MRISIYLFAYFFVCVGSAVAAAPPFLQNDNASDTINSQNLFPGSASVTAKGGLHIVYNKNAQTNDTQGLMKSEDAAAASGDAGIAILGVRTDTATAQTSTTGDYGSPSLDSVGRLLTTMAPNGAISRACSSAATTTADTTILSNPGGAIRYYVTSIGCSNNSAVASEITIEEGGSSVLWKGAIPALSAGGNLQIYFGDTPLKTSANTTLTFFMTTTATSTTCCANAYQITD